MLTNSRLKSRLPQTASLGESGPLLVHGAPEEDTEVMPGEGEAASPSCGHSEASDGAPSLHDDVLPGVYGEDAVQLHRDVE